MKQENNIEEAKSVWKITQSTGEKKLVEQIEYREDGHVYHKEFIGNGGQWKVYQNKSIVSIERVFITDYLWDTLSGEHKDVREQTFEIKKLQDEMKEIESKLLDWYIKSGDEEYKKYMGIVTETKGEIDGTE